MASEQRNIRVGLATAESAPVEDEAIDAVLLKTVRVHVFKDTVAPAHV